MLTQMRSFSRSWFAGLLIAVLAALFVFFLGNGSTVLDAFQSAGVRQVANVGGRSITPAQLERELELFLRGQRQDGNNVSRAEAVEAGVHNRLLESMIAREAMRAYADKLGVSASDRLVAEQIRNIPAVQNPLSGGFDQAAYQQFLNQYRYTQTEFENDMRGEISTNMLMQALTDGTRAPSSYGALLLAFESEQRVISVAEAPMALAGNVPQPNEPQLQAFYEEVSASLRVPEYRALTLVFARAEDFVPRVQVPEERLREEFEARRAGLTRPEQRTFVQISAPDQARAQQAAERLGRGEDPDAVAQALGLQVVRYNEEDREGVADSAIAQAAFSMRAGEAPRAVQGRLAPWAAIRLVSVTPAVEPTFEAERDRLRSEIAAEEAADLLNAAVSAFDDARAGGAAIADAARAQGLSVLVIPSVNAQGTNAAGEPVEGVDASLLEIAFETPEGEASDFMPVGEADVIVAVDRVTPETTRPLAEVREQLVEQWRQRERFRRLEEIADQVTEAVAGGQSFAQAARTHRLNVVASSQPITRQATQQLPARQLGGMIFSAREGEVVHDMRIDGGSLILAVVEDIQRTDPSESPELVERARQQIQQSVGESLVEAVSAAAVARANVRRNERLLQQQFSATPNGQDEAAP